MRSVALIVAAWIVARGLLIAIWDPVPGYTDGDAYYYLEVARSLADRGAHNLQGEPTYFRPPGYPAFLAASMPLLPWTAWGLQSLATLAAALVTLARIPGSVGRIAALLIATSPFLVAFEWRLMPVALLTAVLWVAWLLVVTDKPRPILAGVLIGLAVLLRETALFLPLFAVPFALFFDRGLAKRLLIAAVAAYLVTVPWQVRNATLPGGSFTLSEHRSGYNLWIGTWERNADWFVRGIHDESYPADAFRSPDERTRLLAASRSNDDTAFRDAAIDRIKTDPLSVLKVWVVRYPRMWLGTRTEHIDFRPARGGALWIGLKAGFFGLNALTLLAGLAGFVLAVRRRSELAAFAIPVLYTAAIYVPFHNAETRYSLPTLPFIYLFVGYLFATAYRSRRSRVETAKENPTAAARA